MEGCGYSRRIYDQGETTESALDRLPSSCSVTVRAAAHRSTHLQLATSIVFSLPEHPSARRRKEHAHTYRAASRNDHWPNLSQRLPERPLSTYPSSTLAKNHTMGRESSAASSSSPTQPAAAPGNNSTLQAQALLDLARLRPDELAAAVAAASASSGSNLSPDLVRLSDIVTHATMVLSQPSGQASSASSSSGAGGGPSGPKKYTRSRRGCLTCRSRKVKCDEVRPRCLRCAGMGRDVSGVLGAVIRR